MKNKVGERFPQKIDHWLFHAASPFTMASFRIVFGLSLLIAQLAICTEISYFYSDEGVLPRDFLFTFQSDLLWSVLHLGGSSTFVWGMYILLLLVILSVIAGLYTRVSTIVLFILLVSFRQRNPLIANSGDQLVAIVSFWLMFADSGRVWSLDAWRGRRKERSRSWSGTWVLRCLQLQLCFVYGCSAIQKLGTPEWARGEALFFVLANPNMWYYPLPPSVLDFSWMYKTMTYGTLAFELLYPIFIWFHRCRIPLVVGALLFHIFIMLFMGIPFFSLYMIALQVLFIGPMLFKAENYIASVE